MALDVERKKLNFLRAQIIDSVFNSGNGHIGGALSCIDIVYMIYKYAIKINDHKQKHRFILSKGHACLAQYCVLAEFKYFPQRIKIFQKIKWFTRGSPRATYTWCRNSIGLTRNWSLCWHRYGSGT